MALIGSAVVAETTTTKSTTLHDDIETTSQSIVSRLNPALRKALLKALSNLEIESSEENESSTVDVQQGTTTSGRDEELLEESTGADLSALNQYNSYITDGFKNFTQTTRNNNEIIHTIIVKATKPTTQPKKKTDQVIIRFENPDPVKDSDVQVETVQIARSVKTNEIDDENDDDDSANVKVTTYKPSSTQNPSSTTAETTTTTTTEAPTHNEEGENIEKVEKSDVKIFEAPLVAAFTVQQDALGQPKNVIPLIEQLTIRQPSQQFQSIQQPVQRFVFTSPVPAPTTTAAPEVSLSTTPVGGLQLPSEEKPAPFTISSTLELPTTKDAAFSAFALDQKRKELEEHIQRLERQQRQQEETFRQQQLFQQQEALKRQEQLLLHQRYRFEEENRLRLHRYEQEQHILRHQQQHFVSPIQSPAPQFIPFPAPEAQGLTAPRQRTSVQIFPSVSFSQSPIPTEQLPPSRDQVDFRSKTRVSFQPSQQLSVINPPLTTLPLLATGPQLPLRPAQQFQSQPAQLSFIGNIDPNVVSEQSQSRNRVFRQESDTANFGLNSLNTNFPPFFAPSQPQSVNADSQLQALLLGLGYNGGRSNEDLNIISKVLALNHGINTNTRSGRFVRNADESTIEQH